jgi:hypothetical protein
MRLGQLSIEPVVAVGVMLALLIFGLPGLIVVGVVSATYVLTILSSVF